MAPESEYDYVIVGSGAGGGTLAARLAEAGMRVCLLEAGGDARAKDAGARLPEDYEVPAFHPFASENPAMSWNFFVRHYQDDAKQRADPKCWPGPGTGEPSIFYPRAATLGGCTAHNAMIFVAPNDSDWDGIAKLTGDPSWRASEMRRYLRRIEDCRHRWLWRFFSRCFGFDPAGHGWKGWLSVERALPRRIRDLQLGRMFICTAWRVIFDGPSWTAAIRHLEADPNDRRRLRRRDEGLCYTPLSTRQHQRIGARERVKKVQELYPKCLHIELHALATRVIFDEDKRAIGVEYLKGERLYVAHENTSAEPGERKVVLAAREVILAGGAFNTPQLLMLSGVGPSDELERLEHAQPGFKCIYRLEGVGRNLQDRYEVSVVHQMRKPWSSLKGAKFERGDRLYKEWSGRRRDWHTHGGGMYTSNGAAIAFSKRSTPELKEPDLFCMALLTRFKGYFPGYSMEVREHLDYLSFAVLKAYANNRGRVTLRSDDPRQSPEINFHYFEEGGGGAKQDLDAVTAGIAAVRKILAPMRRRGLIEPEEWPGEKIQAPEDLAQHVRDTAWGHHASCTCPIGPEQEGGVLTSDFKVHGTQGLRVVDASVFPIIPGFFIASAIYMIAEKAADVILREAKKSREQPPHSTI